MCSVRQNKRGQKTSDGLFGQPGLAIVVVVPFWRFDILHAMLQCYNVAISRLLLPIS